MDAIHIRTATNNDSPVIADLIITIQRDEFSVPITLADQPDIFDIDGFYRKGHSQFWVAAVKDEIVGTIALIDIGNGEGALRKMFVKQGYRGKDYGIAAALLEKLQDHAALHGIHSIYLGTIERLQAARRFYEKKGFQRIAMRNLPETYPRMAVDTHFYVLYL